MTFLGLMFFLYFAPAIVASSRQHPSATAIWFANFFLGWTVVGWIGCLIWAIGVPRRPVLYHPVVVPAYPAGWRPVASREVVYAMPISATTVCAACHRLVVPAARFCTMCGAAA